MINHEINGTSNVSMQTRQRVFIYVHFDSLWKLQVTGNITVVNGTVENEVQSNWAFAFQVYVDKRVIVH